MKRTFLPFLIICFVLLCPRARTLAQMQSLASPSTEREIANTSSFTPIKSLAINNNEIVTLSNKTIGSPFASIFGKTKDGTQNIDIAFNITDSIIDFDYYKNGQAILFCGSNSGVGFIGWEDINTLFSANTITSHRFDLPPFKNIRKIYYYEDGISKKMALIGDDRYFIDFNWLNGSCDVYISSPFNKLLDIAITDNYVAVLGSVSDTSFVLYAHEKTNISNYRGLIFKTSPTRIYDNNTKYHLVALNSSSNHVMVSFSLENNYNEHCIIDLNSFSFFIVEDQITISDIGKPAIVDLEYEPASNTVLCLSKNTSYANYIYRVKPYAGGFYTTYGLAPQNTVSSYNKLVNLADYDNNYFLALGRDTNYNVYFFDKKKYVTGPTNCFFNKSCNLDITNSVAPINNAFYVNIFSITAQSTTTTFQPTTNVWDTICN